jgi:hypothetical protein
MSSPEELPLVHSLLLTGQILYQTGEMHAFLSVLVVLVPFCCSFHFFFFYIGGNMHAMVEAQLGVGCTLANKQTNRKKNQTGDGKT